MTITDGTTDFYVYGVSSKDNTKYGDLANKPVVGDIVYLYGPLKKYNESIELNNSTLIKFTTNEEIPDIDLNAYEKLSIAEARNKGIRAKVLVSGVVVQITYANGNKPNGIYLADDTNAIYIYDSNIAASTKIGDILDVAGVRANFILETEVENAEKYGYQGAIQLSEAYLIKKTSGQSGFETNWITETTIKELMQTDPKVANITGTIYKVNALIVKVPGTGFTNYYFKDIDGLTGSYTYSMNNGSDFAWLDDYGGMLKEVYLSVINAKSTASGIHYRFVPIQIGDDFIYDNQYNPTFAVKYYGIDQFDASYEQGYSPDKELLTVISSELLGIENVKLSYASSDTSIAYFEVLDDKVIFKTGAAGKVSITITAIDGLNQYSETRDVTVIKNDDIHTITVKEALNIEEAQVVFVKGIVGASLVNKTGFYLIDHTGVVAVEMSKDELAKLQLGNEVIITGTKIHSGSRLNAEGELISIGQISISNASVLVNMQGEHMYVDASFILDRVFADLMDLSVLEDHTDVYRIEVTIKYTETPYYTSYQLTDGIHSLNIYASSGNQLKFLEAFQNKDVIIEMALVNWNGKIAASVLSVLVDGTRVVNDSNFN